MQSIFWKPTSRFLPCSRGESRCGRRSLLPAKAQLRLAGGISDRDVAQGVTEVLRGVRFSDGSFDAPSTRFRCVSDAMSIVVMQYQEGVVCVMSSRGEKRQVAWAWKDGIPLEDDKWEEWLQNLGKVRPEWGPPCTCKAAGLCCVWSMIASVLVFRFVG